jgi:hypothetical protein
LPKSPEIAKDCQDLHVRSLLAILAVLAILAISLVSRDVHGRQLGVHGVIGGGRALALQLGGVH